MKKNEDFEQLIKTNVKPAQRYYQKEFVIAYAILRLATVIEQAATFKIKGTT